MKQLKFGADFIKAALIRCVRTGAQTALSMITVGVGLSDIDWKAIVGVTATAMIASVLTSIITDLPEVHIDGIVNASETPIEGYKSGDIVRFKITDGNE